ncbi:prepilin peptidase [Vibrio breoganii]|uniref:prepilin peptidase n=1 Tax=Vibrio breoganii TaxID=553239 RepID=UPI0024118353|nr:prepilin peptidase [Vibrio breoganii]
MLFFLIAVYDLREHRIPNKLLLLIIGTRVFELLLGLDVSLVLSSLLAGSLLFAFGLVLFALRAMSPGDVKLMFVVGFSTAITNIGSLLYWIIVSGGIVSVFCLFYAQARKYEKVSFLSRVRNDWNRLRTRQVDKAKSISLVARTTRYGDKLVMPFAPSIVIGMAMFYYFN